MRCLSRLVATTAAGAATVPAPTATILPRLGLINRQGPAFDLLAAEGLNRSLGFRITSHLHEAESLGPPCVTVHDDLRRLHGAMWREQVLQVAFARVVRQVAHVQFL